MHDENSLLSLVTTKELLDELSRRTDALLVAYISSLKDTRVVSYLSGRDAVTMLGLSAFVSREVRRQAFAALRRNANE